MPSSRSRFPVRRDRAPREPALCADPRRGRSLGVGRSHGPGWSGRAASGRSGAPRPLSPQPPSPGRRRYPVAVAKNRDVLTAAELDELSPSERAEAVREGVIEDLDQIPEGFRRRVAATARRLSADLNQSVSD